MPSVTKWRTTEGKLYANKDYKHVNLKDKFMSYAYRLHIYENTDNKGNLHPWWNILTKEGVTDSSIYDALAYVDAMKKDPTLYTKFKRKIEELPELLSDAVLNNALESYIHLFVEYLKETKPPLENTPTDKFIEFYMESPEIKDILRKAVLEKYNPAFLTYLFLGNPDLYADFSSELVEDPVRSVEKAATLQELQDKVNQINASVMDTWKSAFKAVREKGRHSQAK